VGNRFSLLQHDDASFCHSFAAADVTEAPNGAERESECEMKRFFFLLCLFLCSARLFVFLLAEKFAASIRIHGKLKFCFFGRVTTTTTNIVCENGKKQV
jgi:hypothetical protein